MSVREGEIGDETAHDRAEQERKLARFIITELIRQSEGVHHAAACTHDVLLAIDRVRDRAARIHAAQIRVPQGLAGLRIKG